MIIEAIATYPNTPTWNGKNPLNEQLNCKHFKAFKKNMHPKIYKKLKNGEKVTGFYRWDDGFSISITLKRSKRHKETSIQGYDELVINMLKHNKCCFNKELQNE